MIILFINTEFQLMSYFKNLTMKNKVFLLFLVLWLHVSLFDLFIVGNSGPVFYWDESLRSDTILVHLSMALVSTLFYLFLSLVREKYQEKKIKITDKFWLISSIFMVISIGYFIV